MRVTSEGIHQADQLPRHMVTRHVSPSVSAPAVSFPFNRVCFPAMKMNSVSEMTGNASLMLFFVTDTGSALTAPVIRVTPTVFFVAKTTRSVTAIHCFITKQH